MGKNNVNKASVIFYSAMNTVLSGLYMVFLLERKYSIFLEKGAFLLKDKLTLFGKIYYLIIFSLQLFFLYLILSFILLKVLRSIGLYKIKESYIPFFISLTFISFATIDYKVFTYFQDLLDLELLRSLGGGSVVNSVYYIVSEVYNSAPYAIALLLIFISTCYFFSKISLSFVKGSFLFDLLGKVQIFTLFLIIFVLMMMAPFVDSSLFHHLRKNIVSKIFIMPFNFVTDFDFDGYGLASRPGDKALLDSTIHPYAIDYPGNGKDENSIGGDLPDMRQSIKFKFNNSPVLRNIIFVICESMRGDVAQKKVGGEWVMPELNALKGQVYNLFAHTSFTTPSITAMLTESSSLAERNSSIFHLLSNNYPDIRTAVFSGQSEAFGDIETKNSMRLADTFYDSRNGPTDKRMYFGSGDASLKIPAHIVVKAFSDWIEGLNSSDSFFVYINFQELHFPYNSKEISNDLLDKKIKRSDISEKNKDKLIKTYLNAARQIDKNLKKIIDITQSHGFSKETVVVIVGDHGEELYDNGLLGHGTTISFEQNLAFMKIINSKYIFKNKYFYQRHIAPLLHSIMTDQSDAFNDYYTDTINDNFMYVGNVKRPREIGALTDVGLVKYNFYEDKFYVQESFGSVIIESKPYYPIVYSWERYLLSIIDN